MLRPLLGVHLPLYVHLYPTVEELLVLRGAWPRHSGHLMQGWGQGYAVGLGLGLGLGLWSG